MSFLPVKKDSCIVGSVVIGSFDSIVLAAVAADLQALVGGRVVRVTQPGVSEVAVEMRAGAAETAILCSIHARWARLHLAPPGPGSARAPFAAMLRSRLDRARLTAVHQSAFERVLTLRFETDTGPADLVVEIMARHSNLILVRDGIIAGALKPVSSAMSSVREVLPGRPYHAPPAARPSPLQITDDRLRAILGASEDPLAEVLTTRLLGISPTMAREIAARAGLDPTLPARDAQAAAGNLMDVVRWLVAVIEHRDFSPVVYLEGTTIRGYAPFPLTHVATMVAERVPTMSEALARVMTRLSAEAELEEHRAPLLATIRAALAKATRAEEDVRRGLDEASSGEAVKQRGDLLLAYASQIPPGASEATVPGYADGIPVTIPLDPTLTPVENARALFLRYAKMRRAVPALDARLRDLAQERAYLDAALAMVEQATMPVDLVDLDQELADEGYRRRAPRARPAPPPTPRAFALPGGATVLVGRSNQDNDRITFTVAGPDDLWFHARGVPGAHVVLRTAGREPQSEDIARAAAIAAWFSRSRGSRTVGVDYTERRHVRKPKGSRPGFVVYARERTVQVRPEAP